MRYKRTTRNTSVACLVRILLDRLKLNAMNLDRHVVGECAIDTFEQSERGLKLQTSLHIQAEDLVTTAGEHTLYGSLNG